MVKNSIIKRCVFALSVTTCLTSLDLVYARAPEEISEGLLRNKGVPLSRRYLSSPSKLSSPFEQTRSAQKELILAQGRVWDSPSMRSLPQNKSLVRFFQPGLQRNDLVAQSFASLLSQKKTLAWLPQPQPQRNTPLLQSFASLLSQKKTLAWLPQPQPQRNTPLPQSFATLMSQTKTLAWFPQPKLEPQRNTPLPQSFATLMSQTKTLAWFPQPKPQRSTPLTQPVVNLVSQSESLPTVFQAIIRTRSHLASLGKKPVTHQVVSPQKGATAIPLPQVPLRSPVAEGREDLPSSDSPSLLPLAVRRILEQLGQSSVSSVSSVIPETRQESPLLSEVSSSVQREEEREEVSTNRVSSQSEEVADRSHSLLSSSLSLLPSVISVSQQSEQRDLNSVSSVMPERRQENPLFPEISSPLQGEEERERGSYNPVSSQSEEVVDRSPLLSSPLSLLPSVVNLSQQPEQSRLSLVSSVRTGIHEENSSLLMVSSSLQREQELERGLSTDFMDQNGSLSDSSQQKKIVSPSVESREDSRLETALLREKTLKIAEESMDGLTSDFAEINEALMGNPESEILRSQQEKVKTLKRKSAEFQHYLYPLDPIMNEEFRSEDASRRVNRLMSRLSDHLGWVESLELRILGLLNPRQESFSQVLARREPENRYLKLRISSSGSNTVTPLQEQVRNLEESTEIASPEKSLHLVLRLRASSPESRPTIPLEESLETGDDSTEAMTTPNSLHLVLRLRASSPESRPTIPLEESLETGDDSTEAMTTPNSLHLVLRLKASSERSSTPIPSTPILLEEKLESAKKFIQDSKIRFSSIWEDLFGNHTEENLRFQENRIAEWQEEADRIESGLNRFKSTLVHMDEQQQVQTVLNSFDEVDCKWAQVVQRLSFLQSKAVDEQLKGLAVQIESLKNEGVSIDKDLYEDQREDPSPLKGHGEASLNFQETRLSELQKRARKIGEDLMLVSSQVTGEPHSSKRLYLSQVIGEFNDSISSLRRVQSRLNIIRLGTSFSSLETEDPFFSFIPSEGSTSSKKISFSELSTDFTPEEEFVSLEKSTQDLKRNLLEFQETIFGEHAVESLKLHEANLLKLQEIAHELETRLIFVDSQISQDWQSPYRKQINELMYSFGDTLCHVRNVQKRINFLKYPAPSPSSVVSQVNAPVEEGKEEVLNKQLTGLRNELWKIDGDLYVDHGETNLNLQEERLSQLKKTLRELEESLSTLDSQTSTDLQSKEREFVNTLLGSLSTSQCLFREVEKRLNHLKSPSLRSPVIHLSSGSTVLTGALTTDEIEGSPSSLATEDPLAQDLQETEEEFSQLGRGLGAIDGDLYNNHTEQNLRFQEEKLSQLKNLLQELEERLSSLDSKISKDLSSSQRERLNSLLGSFSSKQCDVRDLEKRLKHLQSARLLALDEEILGLERMFRAFGQEERHIDGELFGNHSMENLSLQETNLQLLEKKVQKMESRLMELDSEITKESSPQQREKLDELTHSVKEKLCLHAVQSRIKTLKKLALSK